MWQVQPAVYSYPAVSQIEMFCRLKECLFLGLLCFKVFGQFVDQLVCLLLWLGFICFFLFISNRVLQRAPRTVCTFPHSIIFSLQFFFKEQITQHSMHWNCALLMETWPGAASITWAKQAQSIEPSQMGTGEKFFCGSLPLLPCPDGFDIHEGYCYKD